MVIRSLCRDPAHSLQRQRLFLLLGVLMVWGLGIIGRLAYLQIGLHDWLRARADAQQTAVIAVPARRGDVLARGGQTLATSVELASIYAHPRLITNARGAAELLAPALDRSFESVYAALSSGRRFVYLARTAQPGTVERVRAAVSRGDLHRAVGMRPDSRRFYPHRSLAAHLIGFVDIDGRGQSGVERYYDDVIRGKPGSSLNTLKDGWNRVIGGRGPALENPTWGNDLVLTIDWGLQYAAEAAIARAVRSKAARGGSIVAMDPRTGAIRAMASYPTFNANDRASASFRANQVNQVIDWRFEPGSVFKVITAAAALHEGVVHEEEEIDCEGGRYRVANHTYKDWRLGFGLMPFRDVLANSSNVGTIKVCHRMSEETYYSWLRDFGFGARTGIDLPSENSGALLSPERWSKLSQSSIAFGQEIGTTPLQMATAIAAIANGGLLMQPSVVQEIRDRSGRPLAELEGRDGKPIAVGQPIVRRRVLNETVARRVSLIMQHVVASGTGKTAQIDGYRVAGKTSTAQKFDPETGSYSKRVAGFAGFFPASDPQLVILVVVDEPRRNYNGGHVGSIAAAPAFVEVAEAAIRIMRLAPDDPGLAPPWITETPDGAQARPGRPTTPVP